MAYVLTRLKNVPLENITKALMEHAQQQAQHGLYLEHIWQNADNPNEVIFIHKAENLERARQFITKEHAKALEQDPNTNLPETVYLE